MRSKVVLAVFMLVVSIGVLPGFALEPLHHDLTVELQPESGFLEVVDAVEVSSLTSGDSVEFLLNSALEIVAAEPSLERVPLGDETGFYGINGTSVELSNAIDLVRYRLAEMPTDGVLRVTYQGPFNFGLADQKEEYTRGFRETPGIIDEQGVYLAGSGYWYPSFGDQLLEFDLEIVGPEDWYVISQGNGTARLEPGRAEWTSGGAMDEIYVVGGPLVFYEEAAGAVSAQVFLRQRDDALAAKYLTATAQYIEMYRELIGPYPYQKFALVENFWETGYGMPSFTLLGPRVIRFPFIITSSYPHEILHNWWGNSVFVDYASGNWCEGLTAYMADHLIQEQHGRADAYRRETLQKYRNYVKEVRDFPLREFRSRHSAATEAVGYGKTLMGFHMLRLHVGDENFRRAMASFYRQFRGKRASFADIQAVLEQTSGEDLGWFFEPWVNRPGAVSLIVDVESGTPAGIVRGTLKQTQEVEPFEVEVPIVLQTPNGIETFEVRARGRETPFELHTEALALSLTVDPWFDVFRYLDVREIPPSIGQIFGEPSILALIPGSAPESVQTAYRELVESWQSDSHSIEIRRDSEMDELPEDRAVWVLGRSNRFVQPYFAEGIDGLRVDNEETRLAGEALPIADHSIVVIRRHPANLEKAIGWLVLEPLSAAAGMSRKLPHYGKYSYLGFSGAEPTNVVKGQWSTGDSPLFVDLRPVGRRSIELPVLPPSDRAALIELPPVFSQARLMEHVRFLANPEMEGRGPGSAGLERAAEYVAEAFETIGLQPGGDDGTYYQDFTLDPGPAGGPVRLRNVIGILKGSRTDWQGQAVVVSAHYDHLGRGWPDVHSGDEGQVHPGADDNASGVAVLLELAATMAGDDQPQRDIVFAAFSGEEAGRAGSRYFVEHAEPYGLAGIRADINLDTVGRMEERPVTILGTGTADEWQHIFRGASYVTGIDSRNVPDSAEASDQMSFIEHGIPGVQLFTSAHADYHRPGDTADKIDAGGLVKVATLAREAVIYLGEREEPLTVTIQPVGDETPAVSAPSTGTSSGRRVRFGTVPDFGFAGPGVRVDQVSEGSPAAAAGFEAGDILIRIDDREVTDLRGYSDILRELEPGQTVEATVLRDGSETRLSVTVEAR